MNLESLIHAKLDGEITPDQHAQLDALPRNDWQARLLHLELADQHARLLQQPALNTGRIMQPSVVSRTVRWRASAIIASAAAIVLLTLVILQYRFGRGRAKRGGSCGCSTPAAN